MDSYLRLNASELVEYDREVAAIAPPERNAVMHIINEFEERAELRTLAKMAVRLLGRRFGEVPRALQNRIATLPGEKLEALSEDLLDFGSMADAERWVAAETAS